MKLESVKTAVGNRILEDLQNNGWTITAQYSPLAFDKGIDFDSYTLSKGKETLYLEWTNWFEWEIHGSEVELMTLLKKYDL